jgi:LPS-assembly protein
MSEGGISATYGYEYKKIDKSTLNEQITFGIANNIRLEENKDLPSNSNLGDKISDFVGLLEYKPDENLKFNYNFSLKNNLVDTNHEVFGFEFYLNNLTSKTEYLNENNSNSKTSYIQNETQYKFNENNSLIFETRENKEKSFTEYYNLIYQYKNDCLSAAIEYNKEYYIDKDLQPSENLFFKISILPFGGFNSPNLR